MRGASPKCDCISRETPCVYWYIRTYEYLIIVVAYLKIKVKKEMWFQWHTYPITETHTSVILHGLMDEQHQH